MGAIKSPETSLDNYPCTLYDITEERRS